MKKSYFNFKDGKYGGVFYPKSEPAMEFHADEGYGEYKYVDTYPGKVWAYQLKQEIQTEAERSFPNIKTVETYFNMSEKLDAVTGPRIPRYDEAEAELSARVKVEERFTGSKEQWTAITKLTRHIQSRKAVIDVGVNFLEKETKTEAIIVCPPKKIAVITNTQQAKQHCSMSRYDAETEMPVE